MDFAYSPKVRDLQQRLIAFMDEHIYPNEHVFHDEVEANRAKGNPWVPTVIMEQLKEKARAAQAVCRARRSSNSRTRISTNCARNRPRRRTGSSAGA